MNRSISVALACIAVLGTVLYLTAPDGAGSAPQRTEPARVVDGSPTDDTDLVTAKRTPVSTPGETQAPPTAGMDEPPMNANVGLSSEERSTLKRFFEEQMGEIHRALQSLYDSGESGMAFSIKEAQLHLELAQLNAYIEALQRGRVEAFDPQPGKTWGNTRAVDGDHLTFMQLDSNGRQASIPLGPKERSEIQNSKDRIKALEDFSLIDAVAEFNSRPRAKRIEAAQRDASLRREVEEARAELRREVTFLNQDGLSKDEVRAARIRLSDLASLVRELRSQLLAAPVDPELALMDIR